MKRIALVASLLFTLLIGTSSTASARYYGRPVARASARVAVTPYGRGYYGQRYYGRGYYGRGYYGPRNYGYGPRASVGVGVGVY
jgi:hypothetical protein